MVSWYVAVVAALEVGIIALLMAFGVWMLVQSLIQLRRAVSSRQWVTVAGHVVETGIRWHSGGPHGGGGHEPLVRVSYRYESRDYECRRLIFRVATWTTSEQAAQRIVHDLIPGISVPVHVDPERPEHSVLRPGIHRQLWGDLAFGVLFSVFSFSWLFDLLRR